MSFYTSVQGLDRLPFYLDGSMRGSAEYVEYLGGFETAGTRVCIDWHGEEVICPGPTTEDKNWPMPVNVPVKPDADYYAFAMHFYGPQLRGAGCHPPIGPTDTPCGGTPSDSHYEGAFDLGEWAVQVPFGHALVAPSFEADSAYPPENNGLAQVNWPVDEDPGKAAFLINPSPVWPVPDSAGNEFGMCLFESLVDLPSTVSASITHFNKFQGVEARWHMAIIAYELLGSPPLGDGTYGCIIHYA